MRICEEYPHFVSKTDEDLIKSIPMSLLVMNFGALAEYYSPKISLRMVMNNEGYYIPEDVDFMQVRCPLPEHGADMHPSARYYAKDRNTQSDKECIYCFKCGKVIESFSLLWILHKNRQKYSIHRQYFSDFLYNLTLTYRVPVPREMLLNLDPDNLLTHNMGNSELPVEYLINAFAYAEKLKESYRDIKDTYKYLNGLADFYKEIGTQL